MLKQQDTLPFHRLGGAGADFPFDPVDACDETQGPPRMPVRGHVPIAAKACPEAGGLADVEQAPGVIEKTIHAGNGRQRREIRRPEPLDEGIVQSEEAWLPATIGA